VSAIVALPVALAECSVSGRWGEANDARVVVEVDAGLLVLIGDEIGEHAGCRAKRVVRPQRTTGEDRYPLLSTSNLYGTRGLHEALGRAA